MQLDNLSSYYFRLLTFFQIIIFFNSFGKTFSECQTVQIQIKTDILSVLIWVQTVCKGYQQATIEGDASKEKVNSMT